MQIHNRNIPMTTASEILGLLARAQVYTFRGRLGSDPDYKALDSGAEVASVKIAIDHPKKRGKNDEEHKADWIKVEVWFDQAMSLVDTFKKGDEILVSGRVTTNSWDDKNTGEKRYEVICKAFKFEKIERQSPNAKSTEWTKFPPSEEEVPF